MRILFQNEVFDPENCQTPSFMSVGVLLASIISGRFGLWLSDITITQVLQEKGDFLSIPSKETH